MKKNLFLVGIVLVLAVVYVFFFTSWFQPKIIQISHTSRPLGGRAAQLAFGLGGDYELTEVKVVPLADWQADKNAQPLWHLVSDGSDDVNHFFYGENIGGMDPDVDGAKPQPLQPGVTYRIFVAAGRARGWHDFQIGAAK
jgi:hypothetical protein